MVSRICFRKLIAWIYSISFSLFLKPWLFNSVHRFIESSLLNSCCYVWDDKCHACRHSSSPHTYKFEHIHTCRNMPYPIARLRFCMGGGPAWGWCAVLPHWVMQTQVMWLGKVKWWSDAVYVVRVHPCKPCASNSSIPDSIHIPLILQLPTTISAARIVFQKLVEMNGRGKVYK